MTLLGKRDLCWDSELMPRMLQAIEDFERADVDLCFSKSKPIFLLPWIIIFWSSLSIKPETANQRKSRKSQGYDYGYKKFFLMLTSESPIKKKVRQKFYSRSTFSSLVTFVTSPCATQASSSSSGAISPFFFSAYWTNEVANNPYPSKPWLFCCNYQ